MSGEVELPSQFTHSLKLDDTAKGIRITVHVFANDMKTALKEAFELYGNAREVAKDNNIALAPVEVKKE
jgi:hypothetical protein